MNRSEQQIDPQSLECKELLLQILSNTKPKEKIHTVNVDDFQRKELPKTALPKRAASYKPLPSDIISDEDDNDIFAGGNDSDESYEPSEIHSSSLEDNVSSKYNENFRRRCPVNTTRITNNKFKTDFVTNKFFDRLNNNKSVSRENPRNEEETPTEIDILENDIIPSTSAKNSVRRESLHSAILKMNDFLSILSYQCAKLEEEINSCNENPIQLCSGKRNRAEYETELPLGMECEFSLKDQKVSVPVKEIDGMKTLEFILKNEIVFKRVLAYLSKIFGTNKQRNMTKSISKLVDALISPECLSKYTWTGKTKVGRKEKFKDLSEIQNVLFEAARKIDGTLELNDFKRVIIDNILKYAHEKDPEKKRMKKMMTVTVIE